MRRIEFWVEERQEIFVFLTNHMTLGATTVAAAYRDRWQIEAFFRALKQSLRVKTFVGTSPNALKTQIWTALIDAYPGIRTGDGWQPHYVRQIIESSTIDLGLLPEMQGTGLPSAELSLAQGCLEREYMQQCLISYRDSIKTMLERTKKSINDIHKLQKKLKRNFG